jgi:hypothetical protein
MPYRRDDSASQKVQLCSLSTAFAEEASCGTTSLTAPLGRDNEHEQRHVSTQRHRAGC